MGTISHHQARAHEFLNRADRAIANHNPHVAHDPLTAHDPLMVSLSNHDHAPYHSAACAAAAALRRAATHAVTALAVNGGWKHKSRFQLETVLHAAISSDTLSRSHLKTFRQIHDLPQALSLRGAKRRGNPDANPPAHPELVEGCPSVEGCHPVEPCPATLRRLRRRVASLIKAVAALIAGNPRPVRHHKRWQRKSDLPDLPRLTYVRQILSLPNYEDIQDKFRLHHIPLDTDPDPHGFYRRGAAPRPCPCHADLWNRPRDEHRITLSPPWRHALEKTFRVTLPNPLILAF